MRIEFLTQDDPIYLLPFFEEFIPQYRQQFDIIRLSCSRPMGKRPLGKMLKELQLLYGWTGLMRLVTIAGMGKVVGRLPLRTRSKHFYSIPQLCRAYSVPWAHEDNLNSPDFVHELRQRHPDVLVSVACPYILKKPLLSVARLGCINVHHAPLPRYKGMMPTFWQLYHGETSVGLTVHYMAEKIDEGAVLLQDDLEIHPGESLHQLVRRSKKHAAHCVATVLRQIQTNSQNACKLDDAASSYFTFPTHKQIREFRSRGLKAI